MADTLPNIVVPPETIVDIYANTGVIVAGIVVGDRINVAMIGVGNAELYSGAVQPFVFDNASGYRAISQGQEFVNDVGDNGAYIYSRSGCTINVKAAG